MPVLWDEDPKIEKLEEKTCFFKMGGVTLEVEVIDSLSG